MHIGTQIFAPDGWDQMPKDIKFHFLKSDGARRRVLLVHFSAGENYKPSKADLVVMSRSEFELGVKSENIVPFKKQSLLPPWLEEKEGVDLSQIDRTRHAPKIPHKTRVEDRFLQIASTARDFESVLAADDPQTEINRRATKCLPPQNETRFRLHVLTYMCFGQDMWVLLPPFHKIGRWDRYKHSDTKYGAPSIAYGRSYGNGSSQELTDLCVKYFLARKQLGKHMTEIYEEVMTYDFRCRSVVTSTGMKIFISSDGKPFPTYWQFKYRVVKAIGIEEVQLMLYGAVRYRTKVAATKGSFSENVANLMERVEADGYYTKEHPRGYLEGTSLPPLCVVTSRDLLSGMKLGIGFSFGSERSTAYRMMLFCMAVPKDFFCSLFGIPYVAGEWPCEGLPGHFAIDRGPGARKNLIEELEKRFPIRDMAPSWSGQSKATVESSHPRDVEIDGQPTFLKSNLTPVQLARREIMALMKFNQAADMEGRFEPDSDLAFVIQSPIGLWNHYDSLYRNDAMPISIPEAVRTFLTPMEFALHDDGVWLDQRRYDSDTFRQSGIHERVSRTGETGGKISGYVLDMCVRYIWVEYDGSLFFLEARLRIRGDNETLFMSLQELAEWTDARSKVQSAFEIHKRAVGSEFKYRFKENTGKLWDSTRRCAGKPSRDAIAKQEEVEARQATSARRAA